MRKFAFWTTLSLTPAALAAQVLRPLEFEVASVKLIPDPPGFYNTTLQLTPRGFNANFAALRQIAGVAYGIQRVRIEGGPAWMDSDLYAIAAKAENPDASQNADQIREMLRTLLAERFKLVAHRETKQLPIYALMLSKDGSKMQEVKDDPPGAPSVAPGVAQFGAGLVFKNMVLVGLVNYLANILGSPVHDETGLTGRYNFELDFVRPGRAPPTADAPDIFEAVQDQLGLKLEGKKGPVEVLVVDHAEKATAN
jgi:uncharacterized protein (TIGR03435 family)